MGAFDWDLDQIKTGSSSSALKKMDIATDIHYLMKNTEQGKRVMEWARETLDEPPVHMVGQSVDYAPYREGQRSVYKLLLHMIKIAEREK